MDKIIIKYGYSMYIFAFNMATTTISIKDDLHYSSTKAAKDKEIKGGFSGLIEVLLYEYLKREKRPIEQKPVPKTVKRSAKRKQQSV